MDSTLVTIFQFVGGYGEPSNRSVGRFLDRYAPGRPDSHIVITWIIISFHVADPFRLPTPLATTLCTLLPSKALSLSIFSSVFYSLSLIETHYIQKTSVHLHSNTPLAFYMLRRVLEAPATAGDFYWFGEAFATLWKGNHTPL